MNQKPIRWWEAKLWDWLHENNLSRNNNLALFELIDEISIRIRKETLDSVSEYAEHKRDCIISQCHAGRPTNDGGYEHLYGETWYRSRPIDETPKCECGLSQILDAH